MSQYYRPGGFNLMPEVTKNLLIINFLFFVGTLVLQSSFGIDLNNMLGLHYWSSSAFRPYQFITYMFLHGSLQHILFNMLALWMFGSAIENYWGPRRFLTYYLICGIGAAIAHYGVFYFQAAELNSIFDSFYAAPSEIKLQNLVNVAMTSGLDESQSIRLESFINAYNSTTAIDVRAGINMAKGFLPEIKDMILSKQLVVGASGGVFGLLLAFGMLFPNQYVYVYFALPIKAKYFVIIYGLIELFSGIANQSGDNVAHFAHLGGMLAGIILILIWRRRPSRFFDDYS